MIDILIIGGGIAGASLAYWLPDKSKTLILEMESQPGYHSTGRSAALHTATYGHNIIRALTNSSKDFLLSPPHGFSSGPLLEPRGALWIARKDQHERLLEYAETARQLVPNVVECSREKAVSLCPVLDPDYIYSGLMEPDAMDIDVHQLLQGYVRYFKRSGGKIVTNTPVREIKRIGGGWKVVTPSTEYTSRLIVNASGAWADEIAGMAGVPPVGLTPMRRTALTFSPPEGHYILDWPCVLDIDEEFYFKPDAGRVLVSPADETPVAPCDAQPEEIDLAVATDRFEQASILEINRIEGKWAGLRSFVADKIPVLGKDPANEGFFWLAGLGGYGIMTSPAIGQLAAALITEDVPVLSVYNSGINIHDMSPARFREIASDKISELIY